MSGRPRPPSGVLASRGVVLEVDLLAAGADVWREVRAPRADRGRRGSHRPCRGRGPGVGLARSGRLTGIESSVSLQQLVVVAVSARRGRSRSGSPQPQRGASASPPFGSVGGIGTGLCPAQRRLGHRSVGQPARTSRCRTAVIVEQALLARSRGRRRLAPTPGSGGARCSNCILRWRRRVPLHPVRKHQQDRVHHLRLGSPCSWVPAMLGRRWQQRLDSLPQPVRHSPAIVAVDQPMSSPPMFDQRIG